MKWFQKLFSSDNESSSKRFIAVVLVIVYIVTLFLLMYIKVVVANKDLVATLIDNIFWLILIFGGFIAAEPVLNKLKIGGPKNIVTQDVQNQTVVTEPKQEVKNANTKKSAGRN